MDEHSRPFANTDEQNYALTVDEVVRRYEAAGHSRTLRAIQKYCARGDLDCVKQETEYGQRYRITPESVARHIAQIEEVQQANGRDQSRTDAPVRPLEALPSDRKNDETNVRDQPRPDANVRVPEHSLNDPEPGSERSRQVATDERVVALLERENDLLRGQLIVKDEQIKDLTERARETNHLIAGLQKMLTPLLGRSSSQSFENGADADRTIRPE